MSLHVRDESQAGLSLQYEIGRVHAHLRTEFQEVLIAETRAFGKALFMDGVIMSSAHDEGAYHAALVHPALFTHPAPKRVLVGGGGEGATLREILRHPEVERVTMVDIDEEAVRACREYLPEWHRGAFEDPRVELVFDDVRAVLERMPPGELDVVILDLGDPVVSEPSRHAATEQFYGLVVRALGPGGIAGVQAGEVDGATTDNYRAFLRTLGRCFRHVRPYRRSIPSFCCSWGFALAAEAPLPEAPPELEARFERAGGTAFEDYDPEGHRAMMWLSPRERRRLEAPGRIFRDEEPVALAKPHGTR